LVDFEVTYTEENGKIKYKQNLNIKFIMLTTDTFDHYRTICDKIYKTYNENIVLKKK